MTLKYKCLKQQEFKTGRYALVPLRGQDSLDIMKWRNEQIYHLRQQKLLTVEEQEKYVNTVVASLSSDRQTNQI